MVKLTMLRPRVATMSTSRAPIVQPGSWRAGKQGSTERGYGYRWQQARAAFLRSHPLCIYCKRAGKVAAATVVDHIVPHEGDDVRFWDESNWQPLCKPCHDSVKAKEEANG